MSTEIGAIHLSLDLKNNIGSQIESMATKAQKQADISFHAVGMLRQNQFSALCPAQNPRQSRSIAP